MLRMLEVARLLASPLELTAWHALFMVLTVGVVVLFVPGSTPLYVNGQLVGGFGVSGEWSIWWT